MYQFNKLKHQNIFEGKPLYGTTTLIKEMMPPPLHWWASGKALELLGWTNPNFQNDNYIPKGDGIKLAAQKLEEVKTLTAGNYYDLLQQCYRNHDEFKTDAGKYGTEKHDLIQQAVDFAIKNDSGFLDDAPYEDEAVERFAQWGRMKKFIYSEVHVFSVDFWIGGVIDNIYEENEKYYIGDVKTAKSGIKPSNFFQLGLYDLQQSENGFYTADGIKLGQSLPIAGYTIIPIPKENKKNYQPKTFTDTLALKEFGILLANGYKLKNKLENFC